MSTTKKKPSVSYTRATRAIEYLMKRSGKARMEVQQLMFLFAVAEAGDDGVTMSEVADKLSCDLSAVSRNTKGFGPQVQSRPMVAQRIDPMSPKFRLLSLTSYGKEVVDTYIELQAGTLDYVPSTDTVRAARTTS